MTEPAATPYFSSQLAAHFSSVRFDDIDPAAIEAAKLSMLDTLAVARAGLGAQGVRQVRALALETGGRGDAQVWGLPHRLPAQEAAFVNGVAAAALDFDALHHAGLVHADIVALPAVLAAAESKHASGRDTLAAYVLALDLTARLGMAAPGHRGWFYTSIHGVHGAAAASARLFGLSQQQIADALGLAFVQAGGTQQAMLERSVSKRMISALAARAGVFAARLAAQGLAGPRQAFEGRFGAFALHEAVDTRMVLQDLGRRWENTAIGFKPYPVCGSSLAALQAALDLVRAHDLQPGEVTGITVLLPSLGHRSVGPPYEPSVDPEIDAQFSVR
ncbi:MAG: MmgE/PrpD family protein, partial [Rhodoferax sp.]|nr:MmgE/PrpD family protein [Rhodoferax sp.]